MTLGWEMKIETAMGKVEHEVSPEALREHLAAVLPDYMVPTVYVRLESLPRTVNGKIDRNALPAVALAGGHGRSFVAPRTTQEEIVAEIWREVFGGQRIGIHDNYFDLGGHSISAMRIVSRLRSRFGIDVPVRYVFELPTVGQLAERLTALTSVGAVAPAESGPAAGEVEHGMI
jgi:acyl carrier protein